MLRQRTRISGSARAGSIVGDDVSMVAEARISSSVAADINVDEKEMLDREEWMARAEAHRTRYEKSDFIICKRNRPPTKSVQELASVTRVCASVSTRSQR